MRAELENLLAQKVRARWGENATEYLVGALSSLISEQQLQVLINEQEKTK